MPVANKERKQQARNANTKYGWRRPLGALIIAVMILAVGFIITLYTSGGITLGQQAQFEKYLNEKYGQEFVVENVRETGVSLGGKGSWEADAYPKSDSSLRFRIERSQTTNKISVDTFLQELWTKQGNDKVAAFISSEFPDNEGYFLTITPGSNPGIALYDSIQRTTPTLEDALGKYRDEIVYSLSVNDVTNVSSNEPSTVPLENAKRVVDFVKSQGAGISSVNYGYRDASFTERNRSGQQKYQYRIKLEREALQKISSPSDLKQYFEVIEY